MPKRLLLLVHFFQCKSPLYLPKELLQVIEAFSSFQEILYMSLNQQIYGHAWWRLISTLVDPFLLLELMTWN